MASDFKLFDSQVVDSPGEFSYVLNATADSPITRVMLDEVGVVKVLVWITASRVWRSFPWLPRDDCDEYASCGAFGLCNVDAVVQLRRGVQPREPVAVVPEGILRRVPEGRAAGVRQRDDDRWVHGGAKCEAPGHGQRDGGRARDAGAVQGNVPRRLLVRGLRRYRYPRRWRWQWLRHVDE